jgi:sigma-B regulation protein RsbU (phosphoserine phosphatase)
MPMADDSALLHDAQLWFDGAPCALVVTGEDGSIQRANLTFCTWLGYEEHQLIGRRFQELLTMGGRIFHQTHWAPLMQMQGSVAEVKLELLRHDRSKVTVLLNGVRHQNAAGAYHQLAMFGTSDRDKYERELLAARKVAEDALSEKTAAQTQLQQAQAELHAAYEKAQQRAAFAEQMVAIVSHDLKNPLTAIKMAAGLLARAERPARDSIMLGHINDSADRAERMIADLLDLALARVGRGLAVALAPADLNQVARRAVGELRVAFPQATLVHEQAGDGLLALDADRLQQVIGNLVANAVAYGDCGQPITVTSHLDAGKALVSVHNHGPAITAQTLHTLFQPMTRGSAESGEVRSVGLGLFIVREIAIAHGGDVVVVSSADKGTTFTVQLPAGEPSPGE